MKNTIAYILANSASKSRVDSVLALLIAMIPHCQNSPFTPNPYIANFQDGTLEAIQKNGKFTLKFREHRKEDLCLTVLPMKYNIDRNIRNTNFEEMILRLIGGDKEKLRLIKQMYGAVILPFYAHLFLFHGLAGTGKSSVIKPALKLRDESSLSFVDPADMAESFGLESMIGKLVNVDIDINTHKPIADSLVKKIEDRYLFRINRKNKPAINAPIPALHIFGGNNIPPTLEWGTKAHTRRWTFCEMKAYDGSENHDRDYAIKVFNECPEGVLNFALEGLQDLIESEGKYHTPEESKEAIKDWQLANDSIGQFVAEIKESGLKIMGMEGQLLCNTAEKIERKDLWPWFVLWHKDAFQRVPPMGKIKFFKALGSHQMVSYKTDGYYYVKGVYWDGRPLRGAESAARW